MRENKSVLEQLAKIPEELRESERIVKEYNYMLNPWNKIYISGRLIGGAVLGTALGLSLLYAFSQYLKK